MNHAYNDLKMKHITECPYRNCKENCLDIQLQDDEDITEIDSSNLLKYGGDYKDVSYQCENCGRHWIVRKSIKIKQEIERKKLEERERIEVIKALEEQEKERKRLAYEAKRKELEEESKIRNAKWIQELDRRNNEINVDIVKESTEKINSPKFFSVFHITPIANLQSILQHGILSHKKIENSNIKPEFAYKQAIMELRKEKRLEYGKNLFYWSATYFKKKNPMYNARKNQHDLVILEIQIDLNQPCIYVTDKNASVKVEPVKFFDCEYITKEKIEEIRNIALTSETRIEIQSEFKSHKANPVVQAECLIKDKISPEKIQSIHSDISHMSQLELLEISKPITYDL